jgi:hypothetical protein
MQILAVDRTVAESMSVQGPNRVQIVSCSSVNEVVYRVLQLGGDPYKLGVVPKTEGSRENLHILAESANFQVVCASQLPLRVRLE